MDKPLITVITVVFNAERNLEKTILSVASQYYKNLEYLIIDGASTDNTLSIINKYPSVVTAWLSEPDNGVYDAMNKAVKMATGNWIYFLGAGDVLLNVLHIVAPQLANPEFIYYGDVYREDVGDIYDGKFSPFKLAVANISHQAIFYPAQVFKKRLYNTKYLIQADHAFNMACYGDKQYKFKHIPLLICNYEGDGYSAKTPDLVFFKDKIEIIRSNFTWPVYLYALLRRIIGKILRRSNTGS